MSDESCSCPEFSLSRRSLLRGAAAVTAGLTADLGLAGLHRQVAFAEPGDNGNVLVVLSLRGGMDGLSLVVPHGDPSYAPARPQIAIPASRLIAADTMFGLHPSLAPLLPMWQDGRMSVVHAIGMPAPNRSHFTAIEAIEDADVGSSERRGWINRAIGLDSWTNPVEAAQVGSGLVPTALYGPAETIAVSQLSEFRLSGSDPVLLRMRKSALDAVWSGVGDSLGRGASSALTMVDELEPLSSSPPPVQNGAVYPTTGLGTALADSARLIRANVGVKTVTVDYGNWDHHSNLGTVDSGYFRRMADELGKALAAFFQDLGTSGSRVTLVTMSEFGRRVAQNGNNGLDHGYANAMLVLGAGLRGGRYITRGWPGLDAADLVDGDLAVTCDYRSVLSELVRHRLNRDPSQVFPGFAPETVGLCVGT